MLFVLGICVIEKSNVLITKRVLKAQNVEVNDQKITIVVVFGRDRPLRKYFCSCNINVAISFHH